MSSLTTHCCEISLLKTSNIRRAHENHVHCDSHTKPSHFHAPTQKPSQFRPPEQFRSSFRSLNWKKVFFCSCPKNEDNFDISTWKPSHFRHPCKKNRLSFEILLIQSYTEIKSVWVLHSEIKLISTPTWEPTYFRTTPKPSQFRSPARRPSNPQNIYLPHEDHDNIDPNTEIKSISIPTLYWNRLRYRDKTKTISI